MRKRAWVGFGVVSLCAVALITVLPAVLLSARYGDVVHIDDEDQQQVEQLLTPEEMANDPEAKTWEIAEAMAGYTLGDFFKPLVTVTSIMKCGLGGLFAAFLKRPDSTPDLPIQRASDLPSRLPNGLNRNDIRFSLELSIAIYEPTVAQMSATVRNRVTVLAFNPQASFAIAAHGVFADASTRTVYVAVRGSAALSDWMSAAFATPRPLLDGRVHTGTAVLATAVFNSVRPVVQRHLQANRGWRVVCVGHSLGGAIASTLPAQFQQAQVPALAVVFASPPISHEANIARPSSFLSVSRQRVVSIAFGDDIVPTLSLEALEHMRQDVNLYCANPASFLVSRFITRPAYPTSPMRVCIAGTTFHIRQESNGFTYQRTDCNIAGRMTHNAIRDHRVEAYRAAIGQVF